MIRKILAIAFVAAAGTFAAQAQFVSLDAGTDGVNFHLSNFYPVYSAPVVVAPPTVVVPLRPGVVIGPSKHVRKAVRKARRAYYNQVQRAAGIGALLFGPQVVYVDDDDYYDDYYDDDYMEDVYKARKKAYKRYRKEMKKAYKHHGRHHRHDDD